MTRHEITLEEQYHPYLVSFMKFRDNVDYEKNHEFTQAQLGTILPEQIVRWMRNKVYGTPNPGPDDNPTEGRSNSLNFAKKALSFYMPNKLMSWNVMAIPPFGNPTKSIPVNDLIKLVKKKEVRKQGKPSQARSAFQDCEFENIMESAENMAEEEPRLFLSGILRFQYNMIARIDDSAKFRCDNLKTNPDHEEYSVLARLCWSKNVREERDAPDQILIGAMHRNYCVLSGLATWLEYWIGSGNGINNEFVFGVNGIEDPIVIKERASRALKKLINDEDFVQAFLEAKRGMHSIRKFSTSRGRKNGCSRDETDWRARWKKTQHMQDGYAEVTVPWPDAKVAAALCKGGPIHYCVKERSGISEQWILEHVVPAIRSRYCRSVSLVLGRALLWRIFDDEDSHVAPLQIATRVKRAYRDLGARCLLPDGQNPVEKLPLMVTGADAQVFIELLLTNDDDDDLDGGDANGRRVRPRRDQQMQFMNSHLIGLRRDNAQLRVEMQRTSALHERQLGVLNRNIRHLMRNRFAVQHAHHNAAAQLREENDDGRVLNEERREESDTPATLASGLKTLQDLWMEYEFGIGNRKAAKDFTPQERGRVKHMYSRRKLVWDKVSEMVRSGWDAAEACNKIYEVYGLQKPVTKIIKYLKRDKPNGGHQELRSVHL